MQLEKLIRNQKNNSEKLKKEVGKLSKSYVYPKNSG